MQGEKMALKGAANKFLIWRVGKSVNWECTAQEVSDETGLSSGTVARVCRENGWKLLSSRRHTPADVVTQISTKRKW
jgi:hypothetical protein